MRYWNSGHNCWHDWERITAEQHAEMSVQHAADNDYEFRVLYDAPPAPVVPEEISSSIRHLKDTLVACNRFNYCADAVNRVEEACRAAMLAQPVSSGYKFNSPVIPDGWIACSERMPEVGVRDWRTALPVLVKCEIGVIPAYYGFTYHEGEQCFGFMESIKFGDASGSGPEQHENRLMMHVTHWMPLPAAPEGGNGHDTRR
ncbi:TPA: DUF551 domain-containing protein [Serratia marcescens]|nr:DUF551 domain-containing protein [Serratia marcescens]